MGSEEQQVVLEIKDFEFENFEGTKGLGKRQKTSAQKDCPVVEEYKLKGFSEHKREKKRQLGAVIKQERLYAQQTQFNVLPLVKYHRGLEEQEKKEYEDKIKQSVEEKFNKCKERAHEEGREEGKSEGFESAQSEFREEVRLQVEDIAQYVKDMKKEYEEFLISQKYKIYELVKSLTKWVILRELRDDGKYLERLLKKLILELNSKSNLLLKVSRQNIEKTPGLLESLENEFKHVKNTRVEVIHDEGVSSEKGIILESENGILDGTLKAQFKNLDKLFDELKTYEQDE